MDPIDDLTYWTLIPGHPNHPSVWTRFREVDEHGNLGTPLALRLSNTNTMKVAINRLIASNQVVSLHGRGYWEVSVSVSFRLNAPDNVSAPVALGTTIGALRRPFTDPNPTIFYFTVSETKVAKKDSRVADVLSGMSMDDSMTRSEKRELEGTTTVSKKRGGGESSGSSAIKKARGTTKTRSVAGKQAVENLLASGKSGK